MSFAVKFSDPDETVVQGLAVPFDGPFSAGDDGPGRDLDGEFFSKSTNFAMDWYPEGVPLLYHHGHDPDVEIEVVGRVKKRSIGDVGMWAEAQLDASHRYFEAIKDLVRKGKLYFSSGANGHLVQTDKKSGEILRWPLVEISLTPTPSNYLASVDGKAAMTAAQRNKLPDSDFGYVDSDGKGHFPLNDEDHVRAAISLFKTHDFPSAAAKKQTARKIMARAKKYGIKIDPESAVAEAAGGGSTNDSEGTNDNDNDSDKSFELRPTGGTGAAVATKTGRVLSEKNKEYLRSIMESLTTFLTEIEARYQPVQVQEQSNGD